MIFINVYLIIGLVIGMCELRSIAGNENWPEIRSYFEENCGGLYVNIVIALTYLMTILLWPVVVIGFIKRIIT